MAEPYCKPYNAGLASETSAVARQIGDLLGKLAEMNENVCHGQITDDCRALAAKIRESLRAEGWKITATATMRPRVRAPKR